MRVSAFSVRSNANGRMRVSASVSKTVRSIDFYRHLQKLAKLIWEGIPVVIRDIFRIVGRNN
jgi:hypothetical protein